MGKGFEAILAKRWDLVRSEYFSRWDRSRRWKIKYDSSVIGHGLCDVQTKVIRIGFELVGDDLDLLLIHETAHAVKKTDMRHGKPWQERMIKAVQRANELGRGNLAAMLLREVEGYQNPDKDIEATAAAVYGRIEDVVSDNFSSPARLSFDNLVGSVALFYGFTLVEFKKRFRRAERVFKAACKEQLARKQMRDKLIDSTESTR